MRLPAGCRSDLVDGGNFAPARQGDLAEEWPRTLPLRMRVILIALVQRVEISRDEVIEATAWRDWLLRAVAGSPVQRRAAGAPCATIWFMTDHSGRSVLAGIGCIRGACGVAPVLSLSWRGSPNSMGAAAIFDKHRDKRRQERFDEQLPGPMSRRRSGGSSYSGVTKPKSRYGPLAPCMERASSSRSKPRYIEV